MGLAERIFDGLRASLEMRGDIDRVTQELREIKPTFSITRSG